MKKLRIDETQAKALYSTATKEFKQILEDTFGKEYFNQKITDRIKNIQDIYDYLKIKEEDIIPYKNPKTQKQLRANAFAKIECITEAYNEGVILDWNNYNEYKYIPYFKKTASGGGWVYVGCYCYYFTTYYSVGLYFKSFELAFDAGNKFIDIYNDLLG